VSPSPATLGEFSGELRGRDGMITYREPPRELKIPWEFGISREQAGSRAFLKIIHADLRRWSSPPRDPISEEHQLEILAALRDWLESRKERSSIDLPSDLSEDTVRCMWAGCDRHRLKQHYYCRYHLDLSCLRTEAGAWVV
jgi:hypothetical protein